MVHIILKREATKFTARGHDRSLSMSTIEKVGASLANPKPISPKMRLGQFFVVMPLGLAVEGQPSLDEWTEAGQLLSKAQGALHWWWGDWLNYGESTYGETYRDALELTDFTYSTLANDKYVASRIEFSSRKENLSWHHHLAVAPLDFEQQQYWLSLAGEKQWSVRELRVAIKGSADFPWLRYTDVWNFSECDKRFGLNDYDGRIPGQIIQNLLYYYTEPKDVVIDPMAGGGTTLDVCQYMDRECLAFDIKRIREDIIQADATANWPMSKEAQLIFIDPPYGSQKEKAYGGLSCEDTNGYLAKMSDVIGQSHQHLKPLGILAILIAPMAIKTAFVDLPFELYKTCCDLRFTPIRRIQVPVGSQQVGPNVVKACKEKRQLLALARDLLIFEK